MLKESSPCKFFEHIPFRFFAAIFHISYPTKNDGEVHIPTSHHPVKFEVNWMMGNQAIIHAVHMVTMHTGFCFVLTNTNAQHLAVKDQQLAISLVLLILAGYDTTISYFDKHK